MQHNLRVYDTLARQKEPFKTAVLLVVLTLGALANDSFAQDRKESDDIFATGFGQLNKYSMRAKLTFTRAYGRLVSNLVKEGMTEDEVESLIGTSTPSAYYLVGSTIGGSVHYYRLGFVVSYLNDRSGKLRVTQLSFYPLFE